MARLRCGLPRFALPNANHRPVVRINARHLLVMGNNLCAACRMAPTYRAGDPPFYRTPRRGQGPGVSVAWRPNAGAPGRLGLNSRVRLLGPSSQATEWQVLTDTGTAGLGSPTATSRRSFMGTGQRQPSTPSSDSATAVVTAGFDPKRSRPDLFKVPRAAVAQPGTSRQWSMSSPESSNLKLPARTRCYPHKSASNQLFSCFNADR